MKAVLVLVAALAFATAPFWSGGFTGYEADQFPIPQDDPPVQPAGYAFSIWGLIYLWLVASAAFGLFARDIAADWDRPRWPLFLSLGVGSSWLMVAEASPIMATLLIWVMLGTALAAMFHSPDRDAWLSRHPVALYAGWLTAASSVSLAITAAGHGVLFGAATWAYIAMILAIAIAAFTLSRITAPAYGVGVAWALVAVMAANWGAVWGVVLLAGAGGVAIAAMVLRQLALHPPGVAES